jgi:hypothetical protein
MPSLIAFLHSLTPPTGWALGLAAVFIATDAGLIALLARRQAGWIQIGVAALTSALWVLAILSLVAVWMSGPSAWRVILSGAFAFQVLARAVASLFLLFPILPRTMNPNGVLP